MDALPPLTAESLRQFATDEKAVQDGLAEDCQALEDVMVRLAGPTLNGIEEDTQKLEDLQQRLADPALEGIKRDMQRVTRMMRKLFTPLDAEISKDTTLLTGIAARAQGGRFPVHGSSSTDPGVHSPSAGVGTRPTNPAARPTSASAGSRTMGLSGAALGSATGGTAGHSPAGGSTHAGLPHLAAGVSAGLPRLGAALTHPSPFAPPSPPQSTLGEPEQEPDLTVTSGAMGGGVVGLGSDYTAPRLPAPPPPLPAPAPAEATWQERLLRCCEAGVKQLAAIAQALYLVAMAGSEQASQIAARDSLDRLAPQYKWTDPPEQDLTDKDSREWESRDVDAMSIAAKILSGDIE